MAFDTDVRIFTPQIMPVSRPLSSEIPYNTSQLPVIAITMRRNRAYICGIITLTPLALARSYSARKIRHQIGELHPVGDAQQKASIPQRDFRIRARKIGPSPRNRPNLTAVAFQQEALAVSIVSLADAAQPPLKQRVKRMGDAHKLFICVSRGCILP